jgi:ClpP class serine protease
MNSMPRIAGRLFNTPIALKPEKAEMLVAVLAERLGVARLDRMDAEAMTRVEMNGKVAMGLSEPTASDRRQYDVVDGIAIIPVDGTLVHKSGWVGAYSGMTGYDGIAYLLRSARADPEVQAIWMDFHSPGGEVAGCFDLAAEIAAGSKRNGGKPVWAMVNEEACSAAYALASAADKIYGTATSISGSIGVYMLYVDWTDSLSQDGIKVTFFRQYDLKARGSGLEPMDDETAKKFQDSVAQTADTFTKLVAGNRSGKLTIAGVKAMRSQWYDGPQALGWA